MNCHSFAAEVVLRNEEGFCVFDSETYNLNDQLVMASVVLNFPKTDIYGQTEDLI